MRDTILFLTNNENTRPLIKWLEERYPVIVIERKITMEDILTIRPLYVVSFNYRFIIDEETIDAMDGRVVNLHASYLPWNRGANPNFWSFVENTPKGITIHRLEKELDKGEILLQKQLYFDEMQETFASSYDKLISEMIVLFQDNWEAILKGTLCGKNQIGGGSYHSMNDFKKVKERLTFSWNDTIDSVIQAYKRL